jgi:hypothetical protein
MPLDRNPFPLGKVTTNAGTPVALTNNFSSDTAVTGVLTSKLSIQALTDNVGSVYLGYADMNKSTLAGVLAILAPGDGWPYYDATSLGVIKASDFYIDVETNGDGILASFDVR